VKQYESTEILLELLKNGQYPRLVMENDSGNEIDFEKVLKDYKTYISSVGNYDYITRVKERADGGQ